MPGRRGRGSSSCTAASWAAVRPGAASAPSPTASGSRSSSGPGSRRTRPSTASTSRSTPCSSPSAIGDGAHLVGHSYGGVIALLAAAAVPERVRSLTVIEPPATRRRPRRTRRPTHSRARASTGGATGPTGRPGGVPARLPRLRRLGLRSPVPAPAAARAGRPDADRRARALGGRDPARRPSPRRRSRRSSSRAATTPAFDAVCDVLVERLGAERLVLPGLRPHARSGIPEFNERLAEFVLRAEAGLRWAAVARRDASAACAPGSAPTAAPRAPARRRARRTRGFPSLTISSR